MGKQNIVKQLREASPLLSVGVLTADWMHFAADLELLEKAGVRLLHIDVMDGRVWPKITAGAPLVQGLKTSMLKDVHLLIDKPELHVESMVQAGADVLTFSMEYCNDVADTLARIDRLQNRNDPDRGIVKGLSVNPSSPVESIAPFLDDIDLVVLLAVGPQSGKEHFLSALPDRIRRVRELRPDILIMADGAVNKNNIAEVASMGPDVIVTGSAVLDGQDPAGNLAFMLQAIQ